jgi:hypothetical protein
MATANDYVESMRVALSVTEPDLDTTIGTTARKIIDAVAEVAAEVSVDKYLLDYQYDIDVKQGTDLEDFVRLFGFSRLPAKRATGTMTFEAQAPSANNVVIPVGVQVASNTTPRALFSTVVPAVLIAGQTLVQVPVQAVTPGTSGNVSADTIRQFVSSITGISSFTNVAATTGGEDAESDLALRERFRTTIFRNLAGTEAMFMGVALENPNVSLVNVIGASKRHQEQVEIVLGNATSTVQDAVSVYEASSVFGVDIRSGDILIPGVHYQFEASLPPVVNILDPGAAPDGIYDLEFEYVPRASRNDPANNITNRIDVYVNGTDATEATETRNFSDAQTFTDATGTPLNVNNFLRLDGTPAVAGNYFLGLAHSPVVDPSITNQIVVGANTYIENTDFFLINDITSRGGATQSFSGIEWVSLANGAGQPVPANGTPFTVTYLFNAVPRQVEIALRDWRLVCTDVWVHQAKPIMLDLFLAVILSPGFTASSVQSSLEFDLRTHIDTIGFNGVLQVSDVLQVVHNVTGIDAVRFLTSADDPVEFAMQQVSGTGSVLQIYATSDTPRRAIDVLTGDDEVIVLNSVTLVVKAQNSWGTV